MILQAANFAAQKHVNQRRKNATAEPYINHPIAVANTLVECGVTDENVLAAALLHDTVEDTNTTWDELEHAFGSVITGYVREVSDDKSLSKEKRKRLQVVHAETASEAARLIKMADKFDNMSGLLHAPPTWWDATRIQGYFVWGKAVTDVCRRNAAGACFQQLGNKLDTLFAQTFLFNGATYNAIPTDVSLEDFLTRYYEQMAEAGKVEDD